MIILYMIVGWYLHGLLAEEEGMKRTLIPCIMFWPVIMFATIMDTLEQIKANQDKGSNQ